MSTGPSAEGRERLSALRTKHGRYTKQAKEARKALQKRLKALKAEMTIRCSICQLEPEEQQAIATALQESVPLQVISGRTGLSKSSIWRSFEAPGQGRRPGEGSEGGRSASEGENACASETRRVGSPTANSGPSGADRRGSEATPGVGAL